MATDNAPAATAALMQADPELAFEQNLMRMIRLWRERAEQREQLLTEVLPLLARLGRDGQVEDIMQRIERITGTPQAKPVHSHAGGQPKAKPTASSPAPG